MRNDSKKYKNNQGFTLIEISIVLVIIAFIIGGIVVARSMIRSSQLQSVITDTARYINAVGQFQKQYSALPGDMATATNYWGTNANCATNGVGANVTQTCNGDGNGQIYNYNLATATINSMERYLAWQHLMNAGLVSGKFTGISASAGNNYTTAIGTNIPTSNVTGAGYDLYYLGVQVGGGGVFFGANYGHILFLGGTVASNVNQKPVLTSAEALNLDTKMDDGLPASGTVLAQPTAASNAPNCTSVASGVYSYDLTQKELQVCPLIFITGF